MRKNLAQYEEQRANFTGTFVRNGEKPGWHKPEPTILLANIYDANGNFVCDHLWFNLTRAFAALNLKPGDVVRFDVRVKRYLKGYLGHRDDVYKPVEVDFKLSHPTRVAKMG